MPRRILLREESLSCEGVVQALSFAKIPEGDAFMIQRKAGELLHLGEVEHSSKQSSGEIQTQKSYREKRGEALNRGGIGSSGKGRKENESFTRATKEARLLG